MNSKDCILNGDIHDGFGDVKSHPATYEETKAIADDILGRIKYRPEIAIVLGSGLGTLGEAVENKEILNYTEIPGFPVSTVHGHAGRLIFGQLGGKCVMLMQGRVHFYEGYPMHKITLPIRIMKLMGIKVLFLSNAAGGLNRKYNVGDLMIIKDHLNMPGFAGMNPLIGQNDERFGPRFPPMSRAYSLRLRKLCRSVVKKLGYDNFVHEGVYSMLAGPTFESVAECKYLSMIGADVTGMSTVPEAIVAVHCGMEVFGMSLVTNKCVMEQDSEQMANHEEVLETGRKRAKDFEKIITNLVQEMDVSPSDG